MFSLESRRRTIGSMLLVGAAVVPSIVSPAAGQCQQVAVTAVLGPGCCPTNARFGWSAAIEGNTAVMGSPKDGVQVFTRAAVGSNWTPQAHLEATGFSGWSVAISGDTLVAGAPISTVSGQTSAGAANVYVRSGTTWTLQQQIVPLDPTANAEFGVSVAILGNVILVGASADHPGGLSNAGSAYIFNRTGTTWTQFIKLTASDRTANSFFGGSVTLTNVNVFPGQLAAVIGSLGAAPSGAAYVFLREAIIDGSTWVQRAKLTASDGVAGDSFGTSIASSGATVIIGATGVTASQSHGGGAYVFTSSSSGLTWTQRAKLLPSTPQASGHFGSAVGVSSGFAVVGADDEDGQANPDIGTGYVFQGSGASWSEIFRYQNSSGGDDSRLGHSAAISGASLIFGKPGDSGSPPTFSGLSYFFDIRKLDITLQPTPVTVCLTGPATFSTAATGTATISFQWRHNGAPIPGATGATLSIPSTIMADAGTYDCVITNSCGTQTTAAATLTVNGSDPDCNGAFTPADVATFINLWSGSLSGTSMAGDYNADGSVTPVDVAIFVGDWFARL